MTEAVEKVLKYVFKEMDLFRLGAVTFHETPLSNHLLRKLGLKHEGTLRGYLFQAEHRMMH